MVKFWTIITLAWVLLAVSPASALERLEVVTVGPSWDTFTNRDGSGLYHEVMRKVFAQYDLPVRHVYAPSDRADEMVLQGTADMMLCDDKALPPRQLARFPLFVNAFHVFFRKNPDMPWKGVESLRGKVIVAQKGYYSLENFTVPVLLQEMLTGVQCLKMVLMGRADYYVDDISFIQNTLKDAGMKYSQDEFDIREAGYRSYHPQFNTTERGLALMQMYDEGIYKLHLEGQLKAIYDKWGHPYPDFDAFEYRAGIQR